MLAIVYLLTGAAMIVIARPSSRAPPLRVAPCHAGPGPINPDGRLCCQTKKGPHALGACLVLNENV